MKRPAFAAGVCCLALVLGCRKGLDPPVDTEQASAVLRTALDAWKQGEDQGGLQKRHPPIYFNEPDWRAGKQLLGFQAGKVELLGRQGRCSVKLSLRDREGNQVEREISYLIDTTPKVVIVRENLGP